MSFKIAAEFLSQKMESKTPEKKNLSVNIRQIKNGWIVRTSWEEERMDGDCCHTQWMEEEEYSAENPVSVS